MSTSTLSVEQKQFFGKSFEKNFESQSKNITCKRFAYDSKSETCPITLNVYEYTFKPTPNSLEVKNMYRAEVLIEEKLSVATEVYHSFPECEKSIQDSARTLYRRTLLEAEAEDPQFLALYLLIFDVKQN